MIPIDPIIIYAGVLVGLIARTFLAWYNVQKATGPVTFDRRYLATFLVALVAALPTAADLINAYVPPASSNVVAAFLAAAMYGAGVNEILNLIADRGRP